MHSQVLHDWILRTFPCPHCGVADALGAAPPARVWGSYGMILKLQCKECLAKLQFNGGDRTKLPKAAEVSRAQTDPEVEEEEEEAKEALEEEAVQKKRKMSGRFLSSEALRAVLGCLLGGTLHAEFAAHCVAQQMEPLKRDAFQSYVSQVAPVASQVAKDSIDLVRYAVVRYGSLFAEAPVIGDLVVTNDFFWATRGHYALNGSGTICEISSGEAASSSSTGSISTSSAATSLCSTSCRFSRKSRSIHVTRLPRTGRGAQSAFVCRAIWEFVSSADPSVRNTYV